ncbi:MAG: NAD(P)/FAD-dependent oxidoreductase [Thermodesulfovibrionales bacterium]|nr:NAD(P)/FAD-dependent oxidoreductase [Thermodesulfovibrionales bacterium]
MNTCKEKVDVLIVGASLAASACAKRLVDAGLNVVALERKKLPRNKVCSGILSPRGHRFLIENFGPLPRDILHEPTSCRGVTFHFPSMISVSMDFDGGPTPHLNRKFSDYWAVKSSGLNVHEETSFMGLEDDGKLVHVRAMRAGIELKYTARYVIGADGPKSRVRHSIYPDYMKSIPWFMVGQKFQRIIECSLDEDYFHFWFHPGLGHYTWSHARNGRQILGVGFPSGGNLHEYHRNVETYLRDKHGVKLEPAEEMEGCAQNFGPSLINRYVFGKGNVLITGQAAGFFNMLAEGMSCALHSGAIAGESVVEALQRNRPVQEVYRKLIASEAKRCTDQWNPFRIIFGKPHEADFKAGMRKLSKREQIAVIRDIFRFIKIYAPYGWGRQILSQSLIRMVRNKYPSSRWL